MNCPENANFFFKPEVLGFKIVWTAEKIDTFFNPPVGGARAKLGNQLVVYIIKQDFFQNGLHFEKFEYL